MRRPHAPVSLSARQLSADDRLRLRGNPIRLALSASPWLAASYLLTYLLSSWVLFSIVVATSMLTAVLAVTIAMAPLLIATAAVIRGCAAFERKTLGLVLREPVHGEYPAAAETGLWRQARAAWRSGATWRDIAYLAGLWIPLFLLDAVVFAVWACLLAGITLPLWYRHVADVCVGACQTEHTPGVLIGSFPNGPQGVGASGLWIYNSLGPALLIAAGCLVAFLLFNYALVGTARLHARIARAVLRRGSDPLESVKAVLAEPGPLGPLI